MNEEGETNIISFWVYYIRIEDIILQNKSAAFLAFGLVFHDDNYSYDNTVLPGAGEGVIRMKFLQTASTAKLLVSFEGVMYG